MAANQQFCLRWNNHQSTLISVFDTLLESGTLVDCTLAAEGQFLKAHKVVLSACSPYLEALLSQHYEKHPILILKDVTFHELKSMLDYMYRGEVNISQEQLATFLKAAESLQIKGLTDCGGGGGVSDGRELERARELDRFRELERVATATKKLDVRKPVSHVPRQRSPPLLPPNLGLTIEHRRPNKQSIGHDYISNSQNLLRSREGSVSPSNKRKRIFKPTPPQTEESNLVPTTCENQHENKNENKSVNDVQTTPVAVNAVPNAKKPPSPNEQNDHTNKNESIKREVKTEPRNDYSEDIQNDDSVEDLTMEEEEEEMDEMSELDLSRPGPSNAANSHPADYPPWRMGDCAAEEMLMASQQDSQDDKPIKPWSGWSTTRGELISSGIDLNENGKVKRIIGKVKRRQGPFTCDNCNRSYIRKDSLQRHVLWECGKEPQFQCPFCPQKCKRKTHYVRHIQRQHKDMMELLSSKNVEITVQPDVV